MITEADIPEAIDKMDSEGMLAVGREFDMTPPTLAELAEARALAQTLMDHEVVSEATLIKVLAIQPASTLVYREDGKITGVSGQLMLTPPTFRIMLAGEFDALNVDTELLAREGDLVSLGYGWGIAASSKPAANAVSWVGRTMRLRLYTHIAGFTRAVTEVGRHIALNRYGYEPLRRADDDLMISLPKKAAVAA
jgi:hypothetical protein